jgi:hypothetical protein
MNVPLYAQRANKGGNLMTTSRQPNIRSITTPNANTIGVTRVGSKLQSCYEDMLYKPASPQIENIVRQVS